MEKVLLIVPCFNEEKRLDLERLDKQIIKASEQDVRVVLLFANDGSTDTTAKILDQYCSLTGHHSFHSFQNKGKANIIHDAYQYAKEKIEKNNYNWIGYWDADLATSIEEIYKMLKYPALLGCPGPDSIWASRVSRLGSDIKRQMHRHYLERIFVTIVSNVLNVRAYDSQCGAKLFSPPAAEIAFKSPFISKWIFDVEILLRLKQYNIVEFPLTRWEDVPGSKVKVFKEAFRTLIDLYKIKKAYSKN
jgi:glycosyltransferase involved in cell wall biosynthesis